MNPPSLTFGSKTTAFYLLGLRRFCERRFYTNRTKPPYLQLFLASSSFLDGELVLAAWNRRRFSYAERRVCPSGWRESSRRIGTRHVLQQWCGGFVASGMRNITRRTKPPGLAILSRRVHTLWKAGLVPPWWTRRVSFGFQMHVGGFLHSVWLDLSCRMNPPELENSSFRNPFCFSSLISQT